MSADFQAHIITVFPLPSSISLGEVGGRWLVDHVFRLCVLFVLFLFLSCQHCH